MSLHCAVSLSDPTAEVTKRTKLLPLWLRDGLEKLEKDKKKHDKKELPEAKSISGYQHGSPTSSAEEVYYHSAKCKSQRKAS